MRRARTKYVVIGIAGIAIVAIAGTYLAIIKNLAVSTEDDDARPFTEPATSSQRNADARMPAATNATAQRVSPAPMAAPQPAPATPSPPQCTVDDDCKGPKQADCAVATCVAQQCQFDHSACECTSNDQCDDNIPCTRDLCFSSTMKCIHIEDACK